MKTSAILAFVAASIFTAPLSAVASETEAQLLPGGLIYTDYPKPWPLRNLVKDGVLTIAVTPDIPPTTFLNLETGEVDGWLILLWEQMGEDLGIEIDMVSVSWESVLPGLASGRFDLGCAGAGWSATRLGSPDFLLSNPIVVTSTEGLTLADTGLTTYADASGKIMGGVRGEIYFETGKERLPDIAQAIEFPGLNEVLAALGNGQVDFVMTNHQNAVYAIENFQGPELKMVEGSSVAVFPESLCVNPREADLLTAVNLLLGNYRVSGKIHAWRTEYGAPTEGLDLLRRFGY